MQDRQGLLNYVVAVHDLLCTVISFLPDAFL